MENVSGVAYDLNTDTVSSNPGTRVYGGGQAYASNTTKAHPQVTVGSTQVVIKGQETALDAVLGGSIVSGTSNPDNCGLVVTGQTDVRIEAGTISTYVVGGNNSNWFGRSVIGNQNDSGDYEFNGVHYDAGSTRVSITGGDLSSATVMGGSLSDYAWYYKENGVRESVVFGSTDVSISGGKIGTVVGGGLARYYNEQAASGVTDGKPSSTVQGRTHVQISGGETGDVIGGGLAVSNQSDLGAIATVTGESLVEVSGGIITGDVIGGGLAQGKADATLDGTTNIVISNGAIKGNVYAGGYADGDGLGSAYAAVDQANMTISGGTIEGSVYAGGAALNGGTADVEDFDVRITGGTIKGNVVAGNDTGDTGASTFTLLGASPYSGGSSKGSIIIGGDATIGGVVINTNDTTVTVDGMDTTVSKGYESKGNNNTLAFSNYIGDFSSVATGFDTLSAAGGSHVKMDYLSTGPKADDQTGFFAGDDNFDVTGEGTVTVKNVTATDGKTITVIDGGTLEADTLTTEGDTGNGSATTDGLGSTLIIGNSDLTSIADNSLSSTAGSEIKFTGLGESVTVSAITDKLQGGSTGIVNVGDTSVNGLSAQDGKVAYGTWSTSGPSGITNNELKEATLTGVSGDVNKTGSFGSAQLAAGTALTVGTTGNLTLTGLDNNSSNFVSKSEGGEKADATIANDAKLTLGDNAYAGNKGIGEITIGDGATLNVLGQSAAAATVNSGAITATTANSATVNAKNVTLNVAGGIGADTQVIGTITADAANIKATGGDITAKTVTLKNNGLLAASKKDDTNGGNITIENGLSGQGSVVADKTLTLTAGYAGAADDVLTLQAGGDITAKDQSPTATDQSLTQAAGGKLTVEAGGTIKAANISATNVAAQKLAASGDVAVDGGTLNLTGTGTDASTVKSLTLTNGTQADIAGSLKLAADKTLTVGTGDDTVGGTTLSAKHIDLNGGKLLVDPAWGLASSNVAVENLSSGGATDVVVNGDVGVGRNSYLALGTADTGWLPGVVGNYTKGVGLSETGITAALGVFKGITIDTGKNLTVDGSKTGAEIDAGWTGGNTAEFANNSLLVVNGADAGIAAGGAAITFGAPGGGTLTVSEGAKLLVTDAVAGQTYTIVGNVATSTVDGWKNNGMTSTTDMISLGNAVFDAPSNEVITAATRNDAHNVFPDLSEGMTNAVNKLYRDSLNNVDSDQMGVRFLSRATDNRFLGMDKEAAAESIESAARIAFAGAAPQMTRMASDAGTNAVVNRLGFANPADGAQAMNAEGKIVDRNTTGFALWIAPLWQSQHGWGMEADNLDYGFNGNLGGVSLGADYTFENAIRAGITFNIGGGYAESSGGDLSSTENRMNFWGLGAYAGWNYENFGVMADVSYTSTWNQLKQDLDSRLGMGNKLEADVQASAISAGLRAEYLLQTSAMDIIPHIGVRYMSLNTWGYDVEANGGNVLEGDSLHQDIWTFPIGVTFTKDFALDSGWNFKPSLDFTVIPAAGDIKAKHDVHFTGLPGTYEVETQMMDYLTWQGGVGLELANDNMSIGVNYTLQAGQHTTGHGVFGSFRYEF